MAESADALASGASRGNSVEVQVLLSAPTKKSPLSTKTKVTFFNDVCLWQMMTLSLMMCGFAAFGKHRIIASETSNIIMRKHNTIPPMAMHH